MLLEQAVHTHLFCSYDGLYLLYGILEPPVLVHHHCIAPKSPCHLALIITALCHISPHHLAVEHEGMACGEQPLPEHNLRTANQSNSTECSRTLRQVCVYKAALPFLLPYFLLTLCPFLNPNLPTSSDTASCVNMVVTMSVCVQCHPSQICQPHRYKCHNGTMSQCRKCHKCQNDTNVTMSVGVQSHSSQICQAHLIQRHVLILWSQCQCVSKVTPPTSYPPSLSPPLHFLRLICHTQRTQAPVLQGQQACLPWLTIIEFMNVKVLLSGSLHSY
jgi:hypothetical protein